jgi:hypothetical protein
MNNLNRLLDELSETIPKFERFNNAISKGTVGWHIEHVLLTINGITNALSKSNPLEYEWKFSFPKLIVFTINKIPRGRAKAPQVVQPKANLTMEHLTNHFLNVKENIKALQSLSTNHYFNHPYFGNLKLEQTNKFLSIHTKHHLAIIKDILK